MTITVMLKKIETILFTTNLSETSRSAFNQVALLATQLNAKIVLLHTVEQLPESYEQRVIALFGENNWQTITKKHVEDAQNILIGKISSKQIIQVALEQFCRDTGIDDDACGYVPTEIVIKEGDVVDTILQEADKHNCDLIAMGASKGLISGAAIGTHIKSVMKKAKVPVIVIPPAA